MKKSKQSKQSKQSIKKHKTRKQSIKKHKTRKQSIKKHKTRKQSIKKHKTKTISKSQKDNKKTELYKKFLQNRIKFNLSQYNKGMYKSKTQAFAIAYSQTNNQFQQ